MMRHILGALWFLASVASSFEAPVVPPERIVQQPLAGEHYSEESKLLHLHRKLINIESITGNEGNVGDYLVKYLEKLNLTVHKQPVAPLGSSSSDASARFNIHAYLGSNPKTRALMTSHIDVVPPYYPYELRNSGTEVWGRGSVDDKACVAAQTMAFMELYESGAIGEGDVGLLFVVGEENTGDGMKAANDLGLEWETVVFGEPTEGKLASGHKGIMSFTTTVKGKSAHSGYPWLGRSANEILIAGLAALQNFVRSGGLPENDKYGATTMNIGKIKGGVAGNVLAEHAEAFTTLRLSGGIPDEVIEMCTKVIMDAVHEVEVNTAGPAAEVDFAIGGNKYSPVDIDADIDGFEVMTVNYGTDVPNLKGKHKRYLYGPGSILVAHSDHEHLKVTELEQAVKDYKKIVQTVLSR